jgi:hypothetical protein
VRVSRLDEAAALRRAAASSVTVADHSFTMERALEKWNLPAAAFAYGSVLAEELVENPAGDGPRDAAAYAANGGQQNLHASARGLVRAVAEHNVLPLVEETGSEPAGW